MRKLILSLVLSSLVRPSSLNTLCLWIAEAKMWSKQKYYCDQLLYVHHIPWPQVELCACSMSWYLVLETHLAPVTIVMYLFYSVINNEWLVVWRRDNIEGTHLHVHL